MVLKETLVKLDIDTQKNYLLKQLLSMNTEERLDYIKNIIDNNLRLLAMEQCQRAELVETLRENGIEDHIINSAVYPNYLSILTNYKNLADKLLLINPIELSTLFSYLLWKGYFSKNKHNIYKNDNALLQYHIYPFTIMDGWGVCLNHSIMLADYLNLCGIEATPIEAGIKQHKITPTYIPPIERDIPKIKEKFTLTSLFTAKHSKNGNHVFTLTKENEYFYIYDATNLVMFAIKSPINATCTTANIKATLYPITSYEIIDNNISCRTLNSFITTNNFLECPYKEDYFKFITEKSLEIIKQNLNLINNCYDESHEDITIVAKHIKERKIRPIQ